ncbi:MAG: C4-type zinc ribbon domain-containing protein [Thermodesulfobacteriota bacterium]
MKEQILLLAKLRDIDREIDVHEGNLARLPLQVQDIARNLVSIRRDVSEDREKLAGVEKELRAKEADLATEQEKIKRSEKRLLGIKNQKEYNALNREVKLGKKVTGELEEAILALMTEIESLKRSIDRKDAEYAGFEKELMEKKAEAEQITTASQEALNGLQARKDEIADQIEGEFLKRYHIIKKARGDAVVELLNGSCAGCHMALPAQLVIRILKQEEMIVCPNCQRMIYVEPHNIPVSNKMES